MARIYISSTYADLYLYREVVYRALRRIGHDTIAMEDYVATDQRPVDKCLSDVTASDLYIGIVAWRYGYIPPENNPDRRSITELEFRQARSGGIPCLIFLLDETVAWPPADIESGEGGERIRELRKEFSANLEVSFFSTPDNLTVL